jgi:tRNA nucleotidyltransferase (CCA-adding enzyme)
MAWNAELGLVDLFGGQNDLAAGLIRAVGDPATRFGEDALRILRAFRFSAQLDFEIDAATLAAAREMREGLAKISAERIFSELSRLLASPAAARGLEAVLNTACEPLVFGDIAIDRAALATLAALPPRAEVRLAALLYGETPERARALCRSLRSSNAFSDTVVGLLRAMGTPLPTTAPEARRFTVTHWSVWEDALAVLAARGTDTAEAHALCRTVSRDGTAVELRRLAVNGKELQERVGVLPLKTARLLAELQALVWEDPTRNKKATLLALAAELLAKEGELL